MCPECGGTGEVEQLYHYRGSVKISPEDGAMLDAILGKMYGYFSTAQVEESGDDDL